MQLNIAVILLGFTGILGRWISLDAALLVWYRMGITVFTLLLLNIKQQKLQAVQKQDAGGLLLTGAILGLHWVAFFASVKTANISIALICLASAGLFTALVEPLLNRRGINPGDVLLGLMALLGIGLLFHFDTRYKTGIILGTASAILIAFIPVMNKRHLHRYNRETVTLYNFAGGLAGITLLLPFWYGFYAPPANWLPGLTDGVCLITLSWLCTVFTWKLNMEALKKVSAFTINLMLNLEPVYGVIMAFIFFREYKDLGRYFYIGFGLILLAVLLQMWRIVKHKTV